MRDRLKRIKVKVNNTNCMNSAEFFAYSLLFISILSIVIGLISDVCNIFAEWIIN